MSLSCIHATIDIPDMYPQSQIQLLQEKFARAAKRKATGGSQTTSVKQEPGPATQLSGVVIDLTLDDDED